jgi:hypothetical protein
MTDVDACVVAFQCPKCGHHLEQAIAKLKAQDHMRWMAGIYRSDSLKQGTRARYTVNGSPVPPKGTFDAALRLGWNRRG